MAATMDKYEFAVSVTERLKFLNCDYINDIDEDAVVDLVLNPGEGRFYILKWLFTRYDPSLANLLNSPNDGPSMRKDTILQRLVTAANVMCLCQPNDTDLIKGEGPLSKQRTFIDKLLNLVCTREKNYNNSNTSFGEITPSQRNVYIDALVGLEDFHNTYEDSVDLIPRDLRPEAERLWLQSGWDKDSDSHPPLPSIDDLTLEAQERSVDVEECNLQLSRLKEEITVQDQKQYSEVANLNRVLCLSLREQSQMASGFCQCYQASVSHWCHRPRPQLTDLGPAFHRVHAQLSQLTKFLDDLSSIRQHTTELEQRIRNQPVHSTKNSMKNIDSCLTVLEEALHRSASDFKCRNPLIKL